MSAGEMFFEKGCRRCLEAAQDADSPRNMDIGMQIVSTGTARIAGSLSAAGGNAVRSARCSGTMDM